MRTEQTFDALTRRSACSKKLDHVERFFASLLHCAWLAVIGEAEANRPTAVDAMNAPGIGTYHGRHLCLERIAGIGIDRRCPLDKYHAMDCWFCHRRPK